MKERYPKISIITPSFNSSKYIEDCIQSVLNQNYPNFEHIIIDGGSNDDTIFILKKYSHLIWISETDKGQSNALNKGIKISNGKIVGWLNSDDYYLPGVFFKMVNIFNNKPNIDILFSDCIFVDENNKFLRFKREPGFYKNMLLYYGCYIPSVSTFFNLNNIKKSHLFFDENLHNVMDFDLFLSLYEKGYSYYYCNDIWGVYRLYNDNKTIKFADQRKEERFKVQKKYSKIVFKNDNINKIYYEIMRIVYKIYHIVLKLIKGKYFEKK